MKVSIVMATYNGSKYVEDQLRSIIDQTRPPDKIFIADDLSNDNTMSLSYSTLEQSSVEFEVNSNLCNKGYARNFNDLLDKARFQSDIIFLSDQDDLWFKDKLEKVLDLYSVKNGVHLTINNALFTNDNLDPYEKTKLDAIRSSFGGKRNWVMGCCVSVTSDFLNLVLPVPVEICDHDDWIVTLARILDVHMETAIPLQYYRRHDENASMIGLNTVREGKSSFRFFTSKNYRKKLRTSLIKKVQLLNEILIFLSEKKRNITKIQPRYIELERRILLRLRLERRLLKFIISFL